MVTVLIVFIFITISNNISNFIITTKSDFLACFYLIIVFTSKLFIFIILFTITVITTFITTIIIIFIILAVVQFVVTIL